MKSRGKARQPLQYIDIYRSLRGGVPHVWKEEMGLTEPARPCPFCGNKAKHAWNEEDKLVMMCEFCKAVGPSAMSNQEALQLWNCRYECYDTSES